MALHLGLKSPTFSVIQFLPGPKKQDSCGLQAGVRKLRVQLSNPIHSIASVALSRARQP